MALTLAGLFAGDVAADPNAIAASACDLLLVELSLLELAVVIVVLHRFVSAAFLEESQTPALALVHDPQPARASEKAPTLGSYDVIEVT